MRKHSLTFLLATLVSAPCSNGVAQEVTVFTNVNVIPMDRERVVRDQSVVIRDGFIREIGRADAVPIPAGARIVDGRGRYLIPGLVDAHVHLQTGDGAGQLLLYTANGVTTVRQMSGSSTILAWRDSIADGTLLGPTIYTTGPIVDGPQAFWPGSATITTPYQADSVVRAHHEAGYDFIKTYGGLPDSAYFALMVSAKERGIPAVGHIRLAVPLGRAIEAGQSSIAHLAGYSRAIRPADSPIPTDWSGMSPEATQAKMTGVGTRYAAGELDVHDIMDIEALQRIVRQTVAEGVWNVPTLTVVLPKTVAYMKSVIEAPEIAYVWPAITRSWAPPGWQPQEPTEEVIAFRQAVGDETRLIMQTLMDEGARIVLGTDTPNPFVMPGYSIHVELSNLVEIGMTPFEALSAGTRVAAEFLNESEVSGTIAPGKRADLVLLEGNPLEDVSNTTRRAGVMVRGRWLPRAELDQMLSGLAEFYERQSQN